MANIFDMLTAAAQAAQRVQDYQKSSGSNEASAQEPQAPQVGNQPTQFEQAAANWGQQNQSANNKEQPKEQMQEREGEKISDSKKKRNIAPWHQAINDATENIPIPIVNDFANAMLSYSTPVLAADTFAPEWAFNPQKPVPGEDIIEFNGDYSMPSGEAMASLTPEQRDQWESDTAEGLFKSMLLAASIAGGSAGGGAGGSISPTLASTAAKTGFHQAGKAGQRAIMEANAARAAEKAAENTVKSGAESVVKPTKRSGPVTETPLTEEALQAFQAGLKNGKFDPATFRAPLTPEEIKAQVRANKDTAAKTAEASGITDEAKEVVKNGAEKQIKDEFGDIAEDNVVLDAVSNVLANVGRPLTDDEIKALKNVYGDTAEKYINNFGEKELAEPINIPATNKAKKEMEAGFEKSGKEMIDKATLAEEKMKAHKRWPMLFGGLGAGATAFATDETNVGAFNEAINNINNYLNGLAGVDDGKYISKIEDEGNTGDAFVGKEAEGDTSVASSEMSEDEFQKLFGLSRADYDKLEQRDQFQRALEAEDLKRYYQDTYGIGGEFGYEQWRDLGDTYDYHTQRQHDLVRDVLGFGEDPSMAIPGWRELYGSTGINMDRGENNENDEAIIQAVMDYMWGEDNIINLNNWITDESYKKAHDLGDLGASDVIAQYYLTKGGLDDDALAVLNGISQNYGIDAKDLAVWMMAENLANKDASYWNNWGDANLAQLAAITGGAGDTASFRFADEDEKPSQWTPQNISTGDILSAAQAGQLPKEMIWGGSGVNDPIFSNAIDNLAATIEKGTGKKIKSSNKD